MIENHKTILLIDDEASQRRYMRCALQGAAYNVLEGADYNEALDIYRQNRGGVDVLLTDISLPGRNGYELGRALLGMDPRLKVIFISGPAGAEMCRYYGMATTDVHFLEKPFSAAGLLDRVRFVLKAAVI